MVQVKLHRSWHISWCVLMGSCTNMPVNLGEVVMSLQHLVQIWYACTALPREYAAAHVSICQHYDALAPLSLRQLASIEAIDHYMSSDDERQPPIGASSACTLHLSVFTGLYLIWELVTAFEIWPMHVWRGTKKPASHCYACSLSAAIISAVTGLNTICNRPDAGLSTLDEGDENEGQG